MPRSRQLRTAALQAAAAFPFAQTRPALNRENSLEQSKSLSNDSEQISVSGMNGNHAAVMASQESSTRDFSKKMAGEDDDIEFLPRDSDEADEMMEACPPLPTMQVKIYRWIISHSVFSSTLRSGQFTSIHCIVLLQATLNFKHFNFKLEQKVYMAEVVHVIRPDMVATSYYPFTVSDLAFVIH